jgi:hypothetical protein
VSALTDLSNNKMENKSLCSKDQASCNDEAMEEHAHEKKEEL